MPTNKKKKTTKGHSKVSHTHRPSSMTFEEWQIALRKQMAESSEFDIHPSSNMAYGDYQVANSKTKNKYKVAIRHADAGANFCSCLDFKTNNLGTCKHVEGVLLFISKSRHLRSQLKHPTTIPYSSIYVDYRKPHSLRIRFGTEEEAGLKKLFKRFISEDNILREDFPLHADRIIPKAIHLHSGFRCYDDAMQFIIDDREEEHRKLFFSEMKTKNSLPAIPSLKVKLFPYQKTGVRFITKAGKSILADDMGLGKTIQAIASVQLLHHHFNVNSVLVISPTSLKYQWQSEIKRFTKSDSHVITGLKPSRIEQYKKEELYKLVSYNTAINDVDAINDAGFDMIILDEAQRIKNWETKISAGVKKLQAKYKLILTGTPLENKIQDLYSLIQFIHPEKLQSLYEFSNHYEKRDDNGKVIGYQHLNEMAEFIQPFLLRRRKSEVLLELPERMDQNRFVEITEVQRDIHEETKAQIAKIILKWRRMRFLSEDDRKRLLLGLSIMRMVCNSTFILDQQTNHQTKLDELMILLEGIFENGDEKVVIFSQWERFTRLIAGLLDGIGIEYANLNGTVPADKRKELFDRFNNDENCRVFLSTDAGGVGLNLQRGSVIINMDIPWNPAVLEQRIARVHRHGQTRKVQVINFIAQGTIEHGMLGRLKFKRAMAEGILDNGEPNIFMNPEESKSFMEGIADLMENETMSTVSTQDKDELKTTSSEPKTLNEIELLGRQIPLFEFDDDVVMNESAKEESKPMSETKVNAADFVQQASSFLSNLTTILSDEKSTQELVNSLCKKDEDTGKTYLQIPVADEGQVKGFLGLISSLLRK